ncbi:Crp/Fnr family transcriptional regulator [Actinomadura sp. KC216]|uniref:Crp/Fnr family transcriptional regulator n=1 Tax=Actinomadura sp. KC216 TaxID=2530370 RepID=UPI00104A39F8|nr:Crp/Fnr family transcriptional regulator [Actinomadura sp. KC216]TDB87613.1 Crp/Fnr family transcriptional regulator [Actinomadura sp. KC216]
MEGFAAISGTVAWRGLSELGTAESYRPGEVLLHQGEPGDRVLLLLAGRVKVSLVDKAGNGILLAIRGPGEVLGEIAMIDGQNRSATVSAMDVCDVRALPAERFVTRLDELGLRDELVKFTLGRLRESEALCLELATLPAGPRIVRGLVRLAVPTVKGARTVDIGLNQTEFGEAIGLSRASVAGKLAELRDAGLVTTRRGRIIITDLPRLQGLTGE